MNFQITNYQGTQKEDEEIATLLIRVFVEEGYTDKSRAEKIFTPEELRKRGEIILARSSAGELLGMVICVRPTSPACQVAKKDESEIQLLAVYPKVRGQGIASSVIMACEQRCASFGYSKVVLSTQPTTNAAHHVYKQLGYMRNPKRDWSDGIKRYHVYEKSIPQNRIPEE